MHILSVSFDENYFWDTTEQTGHFRCNLAITNQGLPYNNISLTWTLLC